MQLELKLYFKSVKLAVGEVRTIEIILASPGVVPAQNVRFLCEVLKSGQGIGVFCAITYMLPLCLLGVLAFRMPRKILNSSYTVPHVNIMAKTGC